MRILLTNDDGIHSKALLELAKALHSIAEVIVVAPQHEQSGVGHAFSFYSALRFGKAPEYPCEAYWLRGTPSDCTKFAICDILKGRTPDLVISGINNGENAGVAVVYSGTLAGAREAALWNLPALALSVQESKDSVLATCIDWTVRTVQSGHWKAMPQGTYWSANFPSAEGMEAGGLRRQKSARPRGRRPGKLETLGNSRQHRGRSEPFTGSVEKSS